jgi:hypothetical protein
VYDIQNASEAGILDTIPTPSDTLLKSFLKSELAGELRAQKLSSKVTAEMGMCMLKP